MSARCIRDEASSASVIRPLGGLGEALTAVAKEGVVEATELMLARDTPVRMSSAARCCV